MLSENGKTKSDLESKFSSLFQDDSESGDTTSTAKAEDIKKYHSSTNARISSMGKSGTNSPKGHKTNGLSSFGKSSTKDHSSPTRVYMNTTHDEPHASVMPLDDQYKTKKALKEKNTIIETLKNGGVSNENNTEKLSSVTKNILMHPTKSKSEFSEFKINGNIQYINNYPNNQNNNQNININNNTNTIKANIELLKNVNGMINLSNNSGKINTLQTNNNQYENLTKSSTNLTNINNTKHIQNLFPINEGNERPTLENKKSVTQFLQSGNQQQIQSSSKELRRPDKKGN